MLWGMTPLRYMDYKHAHDPILTNVQKNAYCAMKTMHGTENIDTFRNRYH